MLALLNEPWCFSILGNHEDALLAFEAGLLDVDQMLDMGADWFLTLPERKQHAVLDRVRQLPLAIELQTATGSLGLVHAECPSDSWSQFMEDLNNRDWRVREQAIWSRKRIKTSAASMLSDVRAVVAGHTPVSQACWLGNTLYIDTGAWSDPHSEATSFCMLDAATLEPAGAAASSRIRISALRLL